MKKLLIKYFITLLIIIPSAKILSQVHVSLPDTTAKSNTFIFIPVFVTDLTNKNVKSYDFTVSFNKNILKAEGISTTNSLTNQFTWNAKSEIRKSSIKVEASGIFALGGNGTLIFLKFKVIGISGSSNLIFNSFVFNSGSPPVVKHNGKFTVYVEKWLKIKKIGKGKGNISVNDIEYQLPYEKLLKTNETYKLFAIPSTGSKFVRWEGDILSSNNPYYLELNDNTEIDVRFNLKRYSITLQKEPPIGGSVTGGGRYEYGKNIIVKAIPADNWYFDSWTEDGKVVSDTSEYAFEVQKNRTLTANFTAQKYIVTGNTDPLNAGSISGLGEYVLGTTATLTANATEGWNFLGWQYSYEDTIFSNSPVIEIVVNNNFNLIAKFSKSLFSVSTTSNPTEGGVASGGGYFYLGQKAELNAVANTGWQFVNWTLDGKEISDKKTIEFNVKTNINFVANFKKLLYSLTASSKPIEAGIINGSGFYYFDQSAIVTANANDGWQFKNWTVNDSVVSSELTYEIVIKNDTNLTANFSLVTDINSNNDEFKNNFITSPFPNPFNPSTTFQFGITDKSVVNLTIYDLTGKMVQKLINNKDFTKGVYSKTFNANNLSNGVYFYRFTSTGKNSDNNVYKSGKILLIK